MATESLAAISVTLTEGPRIPGNELYSDIERDIKTKRLEAQGISASSIALVSLYATERNSARSDIKLEALARKTGSDIAEMQATQAQVLQEFGVRNLAQAYIFAELRGILPLRIPGIEGSTRVPHGYENRESAPNFYVLREEIHAYLAAVSQGERPSEATVRLKLKGIVGDAYTKLGVTDAFSAVRLARDFGYLPVMTSSADIFSRTVGVCPPFTREQIAALTQIRKQGVYDESNPTLSTQLKRLLGVSGDTYGLENFVSQITGRQVGLTATSRRVATLEEPIGSIAGVRPTRREEPTSDDLALAHKWVSGVNANQLALQHNVGIGQINDALMRVRIFFGQPRREDLRKVLVQEAA